MYFRSGSWNFQTHRDPKLQSLRLQVFKHSAGVVRSVMTFGLFVELDLGQSDGPWGFVAPEDLKKDLQKRRCEDGSSKTHVKKDAIQMGEELQVRVLANSAMSTLADLDSFDLVLLFFFFQKDGHGNGI